MQKKDVFEGLAKVIYSEGLVENREIDGETFKIYAMGEFTMVVSKHEKGWVPTGLTFELFGNEFFLASDSVVSLVEEEITSNAVYAITDENLRTRIENFLKWRLNVLTEFRL